MSRTSNEPAAPNASNFLNNFKYEVANELGINNYQTVDKGQLTSRENGYVGGYMVNNIYPAEDNERKKLSTKVVEEVGENAEDIYPAENILKNYVFSMDEVLKNEKIKIIYIKNDIEFLRNYRQRNGHLYGVYFDLRVYFKSV